MKRYFTRILIALLAVVSVLFGSGLNVYAITPADILEDVNHFNLLVDTRLNSHNDFSRTISFGAQHNELEPDLYFYELSCNLTDAGLSEEVFSYSRTKSATPYIFKLEHATLDELMLFTSTILPGSTVEVQSNEAEIGLFKDSYQFSESLSYAARCSDMDASCTKFNCTYVGFEDALESGGGIVNGNTLTYVDKIHTDGSVPASFSFSNSMTYKVEDISVVTDVSSANIMSVAVVLDFENVTDASGKTYSVGLAASNHFIDYVKTHEDNPYNHPKLRRESYVVGSTANLIGSSTDSTSVDTDYRLALRAEGNFETVSETLSSVFGSGNYLTISSGKVNSSNFLYDRNTIVHSIDLSALCKDAGFSLLPSENSPAKTVNYSFTGSIGSGLLDFVVDGKSIEVEDNTATGTAGGPVFKAVVDYEALDIGALIITILVGAGILCLASFLFKLFRRRSGKKRQLKSEDIRYEAVKSVALALVPDQERAQMLEVPSELINRPTIVIKPKSDDGLDDEDDEPESVVLFSMMLRILLTVQLVLFFFPYFNVNRTNLLDSVTSITGLDLFQGFELSGVAIEPNRFAIILFILPLVMLICLMAHRSLPKLALPVAVSGGSVFSIFYLISLNNSIYDTLSPAIEAAASSGSFVSQPSSQTGFDYSLVIYIILAIGGIVLLFSNILAILALRRHQRDEEMRRFEK